ncbi:Sfi1 spindle body protein-domain-containing protein [Crucibulum laeve]|uniref:Sfi1 spindle body protein-domain-containing protein n=1 Tax=Crucibulum laeve TaxID=68775 RepID=A0A5C3MDD0_9AGAR|nr:Sfi1 spindle body protein-domain-containing protein [Crucibulum laeve]
MSKFQPTRASPPSKLSSLVAASTTHAPDISRSSAVSIPELKTLDCNDVEILDAIIERAGASATTFLTVFKAYNDVLYERGLDPHEVVYYGKLLKLGTLKGKNWGEKWIMVKEMNGYVCLILDAQLSLPSHMHPDSKFPKQISHHLRPPKKPSNILHVDDTFQAASIPRTSRYTNPSTSRPPSPTYSEVTVDSDDLTRHPMLFPPTRPTLPVQQSQRMWDVGLSDDSSRASGPSIQTPPSYRSTPQNVLLPKLSSAPISSKVSDRPVFQPAQPALAARQAVARARERKGSVVNEDEAWKNIRMQRDEEDADKFHEDRLVERCWEVWKEGLRWIITTNRQISEARDNLLIRLTLQRWQSQYITRKELADRTAGLFNDRHMRRTFNTWKAKLKERKQTEWRNNMRRKMKYIKEKRESSLRKDAWAKWRQQHRSHLAMQYYSERLVLRFYTVWKRRLEELDGLEAIAEDVSRTAENSALEKSWKHWRTCLELRAAERTMAERVNLRIIGNVLDTWRKSIHDCHISDDYYNFIIMKRFLGAWKSAVLKIRNMESRAEKHVSRQDALLLHAVTRVWRAHERGHLLERVRTTRLLKQAWTIWQSRLQKEKQRTELASSFASRVDLQLLLSSFHRWQEVHRTHRNAQAFAVQYHSAQLRYKVLLTWRVELRKKLKMVKVARMADRFFATRHAWRAWSLKLDEKKREKKLKLFEKQKLVSHFSRWIQRSRQVRHHRMAEQAIQDFVSERFKRNVLSQWTNRVIEVKLRELDAGQRYDLKMQAAAFKKWKEACLRHVEEVNLLESYLFVKKEDNVRRVFSRWLASARATRYRRLTLQRREDQLKLATSLAAWDKWRDRFIDEKLRPIEYDVILQMQKNLMFRAFGIWHGKTKSLPAIRFHANNSKTKYFKMWRETMPRAVQAREARERDRKALLRKSLDQWIQAYKTKIALKAVARARYLRLPTSAPRTTIASRPNPALSAPRNAFLRRAAQTKSEDDNDSVSNSDVRVVPSVKPFGLGAGVVSLLRTTARPERSPPRSLLAVPRARERSPARSTASLGDRGERSRPTNLKSSASVASTEDRGRGLWQELQEVRKKSRPSSRQSRTAVI